MLGDGPSHKLLSALAQSTHISDVVGSTVDGLGQIFDVKVRGVVFVDAMLRTTEIASSGIRDTDYEEYERDWRHHDRVLGEVVRRQVPVHNAQIYSERELTTDPIYAEYGRRVHVYRYLCAPLYGSRGDLQGVMRVCRGVGEKPFDGRDLSLITALGGYISSSLARVLATESPEKIRHFPMLTYREMEIASLVSSGRNNKEIALHLGIARETVKQTLRRVYLKLEVNSRAEMAARLARRMLI